MELNNSDRDPEDAPELFEHFRFVIDPGQGFLRIDKFLMDRIQNASRTKIQAAADYGNILVNDNPVKASYKVKPGDIIRVLMDKPVRQFELLAEDIPLDVIYEDSELIVVNKPAGMVVHPAYGNHSGTLVNALLHHFRKYGDMAADSSTGPYLVHRIDKDTSGIMMVAKNEIAQRKLQSQFYHHTIDRKYVALVWGDFENDMGTIDGHIGRSRSDRKVFAVYTDGSVGKNAITHYSVIERFGYVTLVECRLETGRTHQIRVHFSHIGHPLFNDETYGGDKILRGTVFSKYQQFVQNCFKLCPRQALHAAILGFIHPVSGKKMRFESPLPDDFRELTVKWRHYTMHRSTGLD